MAKIERQACGYTGVHGEHYCWREEIALFSYRHIRLRTESKIQQCSTT